MVVCCCCCFCFLIRKLRNCTSQTGVVWLGFQSVHTPKGSRTEGRTAFSYIFWCLVLNLHTLPGDFLKSGEQPHFSVNWVLAVVCLSVTRNCTLDATETSIALQTEPCCIKKINKSSCTFTCCLRIFILYDPGIIGRTQNGCRTICGMPVCRMVHTYINKIKKFLLQQCHIKWSTGTFPIGFLKFQRVPTAPWINTVQSNFKNTEQRNSK